MVVESCVSKSIRVKGPIPATVFAFLALAKSLALQADRVLHQRWQEIVGSGPKQLK